MVTHHAGSRRAVRAPLGYPPPEAYGPVEFDLAGLTARVPSTPPHGAVRVERGPARHGATTIGTTTNGVRLASTGLALALWLVVGVLLLVSVTGW